MKKVIATALLTMLSFSANAFWAESYFDSNMIEPNKCVEVNADYTAQNLLEPTYISAYEFDDNEEI